MNAQSDQTSDGANISPRPPGQIEEIGAEVGRLADKRQRILGGRPHRRVTEILAIIYPKGIKTHQYGDVLAMIHVLERFLRIATTDSTKMLDSYPPWQDVAVYGLLMTDSSTASLIDPDLDREASRVVRDAIHRNAVTVRNEGDL